MNNQNGTYTVRCSCSNCGLSELVTILFGTKVSDKLCNNCGCKSLYLNDFNGYNSNKDWFSNRVPTQLKYLKDSIYKYCNEI